MNIGVPKEIKTHERRVSMTPEVVKELTKQGHTVYVQTGAGAGIAADDTHYERAGATILSTAADVFEKSTMIVKVKEPQPGEWRLLKEHHILFTYLHLAADAEQAKGLVDSGCTAIAYETVTDAAGRLPLLAPMSSVAGSMSVRVGAQALESIYGGSGVLLSHIAGIAPAKVVVLGAGVAGRHAVRVALGMGAHVTVIDVNMGALSYLSDIHAGQGLVTLLSNAHNIEESVTTADLVIGSILIPGASAPKLVGEDLVKAMRKGSALVDIAIDQGGCFATSKPTTHQDPYYIEHDVVHYCVTNMPGAVPRTSTLALGNATSAFILRLARDGVETALKNDPHLLNGLNVYKGKITHKSVAEALGMVYSDPRTLLS